jgi:hypothetical protein
MTRERYENSFFEFQSVEPAFNNTGVKWHAMLRHFIDDFGVEQEIDVIHQQRF